MPVSTTSSGKFVGESCHKLIRNCESLFMPTFEKAIGNAVETRFVENRFEIHLEIICKSFFMPAFENAIGNAVENRFVENRFEIHLEIIYGSFFMPAFEKAIGNAVEKSVC
jgi:hypothetical protein